MKAKSIDYSGCRLKSKRCPKRLCNGPSEHHLSNQKEVCRPLLTSIKQNCVVCCRYWRSFLHIQEPDCALCFIDQKEPFQRSSRLIQSTQREEAEVMRQTSLKQQTLLASTKDFSPSPPSFFGRHTSFHATLAFFLFKSGPDQRKADYIVSISFMHALGRRKPEIY